MTRSILIAVVIAVAVAGWIVSGQFGSEPRLHGPAAATAETEAPPPAVRVRRQTAEPRVTEVTLFGRTEADRRVEVRAETSGRVAAVEVEKGAVVQANDVLARIDQEDRPARLAEAKARVEQARIAYDASRQLEDRAFRSRVQLAADAAELESARAALASIQESLSDTVIRAPFAGTVELLPVEHGEYLDTADPVATIVDLDPLVVVGQVVEDDIGRIAPGATAYVRVGRGAERVGTVRYVARTADEATRTFAVEVAIANPDGSLREGLTAEMRLPVGELMAHRVSPAVLSLSDEGAVGVKVVDPDNEVEFIPVTIIADTPDGVWLAGLPETVTLITVGQEFVIAGEKVTPVPESEIAPADAPAAAPSPPRGPVPIAGRDTL